MKRQIKFRGKSTVTGDWLYGDLVRNVNGAVAISPKFKIDEYNELSCYEVNPDTVGQFTGLCDKDGTEIYEGDILQCEGGRSDNKGKIYRREVTFCNDCFCMHDKAMNVHSPLQDHFGNGDGRVSWSAIGNVYDAPDLLKGGEE